MLLVISDHTPEIDHKSRVIWWEHWSALGPGSLLEKKGKEWGPPQWKERTEWGIEGRKGRRPFRSASIFCSRYSPFLPTNEPGLSQYLNKQQCCKRCLNGLVGNVTRPFTYLRFAICQDEFGPSEKPFFQCFFFRLVFSFVAVFISFTCLFPARQIAVVRKKNREKSWFRGRVDKLISFVFCP